MLHAGSRKALSLLVAASLSGCVSDLGPTTCDRSESGNPAVLYSEGVASDGVYMSSPWDGELLYFPGGMRYELEHHLGATPRFFQPYLSFSRYGTKGASGESDESESSALSPAAGNQVEVTDLNPTTMTVINGSCVEYWLLVVAEAPSGAGGGSGE